jgi:hypothetical protein
MIQIWDRISTFKNHMKYFASHHSTRMILTSLKTLHQLQATSLKLPTIVDVGHRCGPVARQRNERRPPREWHPEGHWSVVIFQSYWLPIIIEKDEELK